MSVQAQLGGAAGGLAIWLVLRFMDGMLPSVILGTAAAVFGVIVTLPFIYKEIKILVRL